MLEELIQIDHDLFIFLNGLGSPLWDGFWNYLSRTLSFITIPIYSFILFYIFKKFSLKKAIFILILATLLILSTEQLSIAFKNSFLRLRPCHTEAIKQVFRSVRNHCGGKYGYFSAHAANSSAFASYFGILLYKKNKYITVFLTLWALLVSYSRIYLGVHFPLDVITGLFFGVSFGWLFATQAKRW
ncbi:phosphatase PAP2 family protein [Cellulophaga baltica]|uniref:phosphatase PAP2 family protein n=1 Tax=Cellulophaga TaxID=104264 RepID=UPI001C068598|nr:MULTISPECIES: phosphatase PAP2 family protein [Cellulophaga]MBU2995174.1 phosphatase PAP2 family protein [Cellulophaga baltica]MDO6766569.1 phosphatase PAP2 family protein [Cellulophaga sp. 1_MG-2023]